MRVNVLRRDNGAGFSRDGEVLVAVLGGVGWDVSITDMPRVTYGGRKLRVAIRQRVQDIVQTAPAAVRRTWLRTNTSSPAFDVNLFCGSIDRRWLRFARHNLLIPNQEGWTREDEERLSLADLVLCKTRHAEAIFKSKGRPTMFTSFSSLDRRLPGGEVDDLAFLHTAKRLGRSNLELVVDAWREHPQWPSLTVVDSRGRLRGALPSNIHWIQEHLPDTALRQMQNRHAVHLVPSDSEGFGHRIVEALSCGALCVTTDGPPMNELITSERGVLVATRGSRPQGLGRSFDVDGADFGRQVERVIDMHLSTRRELALAGRAWFEDNHLFFVRTLTRTLAQL